MKRIVNINDFVSDNSAVWNNWEQATIWTFMEYVCGINKNDGE